MRKTMTALTREELTLFGLGQPTERAVSLGDVECDKCGASPVQFKWVAETPGVLNSTEYRAYVRCPTCGAGAATTATMNLATVT